jgi:hypothetical protein
MIGFLIGIACTIGLVKVLRRGRGCGYHGGGWHGHHGHRHGRGRGRGGFFMRGLFERLDTTPGQEKVMREAFDELRDSARGMKDEVRHTRDAVSDALRAGIVDETQLGTLFAHQDERLTELRKAFIGALAKVNDALDEDQRRKLADIVGSGRGFGWGGPYRSWA